MYLLVGWMRIHCTIISCHYEFLLLDREKSSFSLCCFKCFSKHQRISETYI
jgi:hypothetical protein